MKSNTAMTALFLQQSMLDSEKDYERSIDTTNIPRWDAVVLTASNEDQAKGFEMQLEHRRLMERLPSKTRFFVIPDRDGKRVGSGGSTLSVIRELKKVYGSFEGKKILVIHAGGNSSRCPQFSALGKIFSPIPASFNDVPATLFDLAMVTMASMPGRLKEGMLLLSGDVALMFNPLMCDFGSSDAAVISFKENVSTAQNHGVYIRGENGNVKSFLHKKDEKTLRALGAVDDQDSCSIDTGAIEFSPRLVDKLYSLIDTDEKYDAMVNERVRLSLYGDIAYCLAEDSELTSYLTEAPEGEFCEELTAARRILWDAIGSLTMKQINVSPSKFVHFGSIPEIIALMTGGVEEYGHLGWKKRINSSIPGEAAAGYNSVLSQRATIGTGCYLETSYVHSGAVIGSGCYLSFVDIHDETIPDNLLVHGLKQSNGRFVCRIISTGDNPKSARLFGQPMQKVAESLGVTEDELYAANEDHILWNASIYPEQPTIREAVKASLNLYALVTGQGGDEDAWKRAKKRSLCSGFNNADPGAVIAWSKRMEELVRMNDMLTYIRSGAPARDAASVLRTSKLTQIQKELLEKELSHLDEYADRADFSYKIRLYYYLGAALDSEKYTAKCFDVIADTILHSTLSELKYNDDVRIANDETLVKLPLRVNWGGGWTDTCPYCNEHGGVVLNAAITLNGKYPVSVRLKKIPERKIVFDSRDMDVHGEFDEIAPLQRTGDPYDPFALQKACLLACGIIPQSGGDLGQILDRMGGGFEMHSEVTNVPKGSGLGTSSILSAATVKAILEFTSIPYTDDTLFSTVLAMEQIMSTGGGWQDQVGGALPGIKFITSEPGIRQDIKVEKVEISEATKNELSERFAIIYTGQRRLARNLLRDVVGRYVGNEPDSLIAHREIQKKAALMRFALERGDVDEFAKLLDEHWALSQMIDSGSSNMLIDQIFTCIEDLIDARMICGAGGGGFLQVVLKRGVTKKDVHRRLRSVFRDFEVDVWSAQIIY